MIYSLWPPIRTPIQPRSMTNRPRNLKKELSLISCWSFLDNGNFILVNFFLNVTAELSGARRRRVGSKRLRLRPIKRRQGGSPGLLGASARMTWCALVLARIKSFEAGQFRRCAPFWRAPYFLSLFCIFLILKFLKGLLCSKKVKFRAISRQKIVLPIIIYNQLNFRIDYS